MTALGQLSSDRDCIRASKIRAIYYDGDLIFNRVFDQRFLFIDGFIEISFWKTDCTIDVSHFVKNERSHIEDQRRLALVELIKSPERHAGDGSRSDCGCGEDLRSLVFSGRWLERWDGLVLRIIARCNIQARSDEASDMKNLPSVRMRCLWVVFQIKRF